MTLGSKRDDDRRSVRKQWVAAIAYDALVFRLER